MDRGKLDLKEIGAPKLIILFLAGIFLIFLSISDFGGEKEEPGAGTKEPEVQEASSQHAEEEPEDLVERYEAKLKNLLEKVTGVGRSEVMITLKSSAELVVLKDTPYTQSNTQETDSEGGQRRSEQFERGDSAVLIEDENGRSVPYVTKELNPVIEGVLVIAEGAGYGTVSLDIMTAVQVLFNVPVHKISVLPMEKSE